MAAITRQLIARLQSQIEDIARKVDPVPELVLVVVDDELDALLGKRCNDMVVERHVALFPADARARTFLIVRTGASRGSAMGKCDQASAELLREIKARLQ